MHNLGLPMPGQDATVLHTTCCNSSYNIRTWIEHNCPRLVHRQECLRENTEAYLWANCVWVLRAKKQHSWLCSRERGQLLRAILSCLVIPADVYLGISPTEAEQVLHKARVDREERVPIESTHIGAETGRRTGRPCLVAPLVLWDEVLVFTACPSRPLGDCHVVMESMPLNTERAKVHPSPAWNGFQLQRYT